MSRMSMQWEENQMDTSKSELSYALYQLNEAQERIRELESLLKLNESYADTIPDFSHEYSGVGC